MNRRFAAFLACGAFLFVSGGAVHAETADLQALSERGVAQALAWQTDRAESTFLSVLSAHRGDASALNNLGNLSLLKGELAVALSFYQSARLADPADAGISLNRSVAYLLMGEEGRAVEEAAQAIRMAGGAARAGALIGVRSETADSTRAAQKKWLSKTELRELLDRASRAVPRDTTRRTPPGDTERGQGRRVPIWRHGVTRAADDRDSPTLLYWKH